MDREAREELEARLVASYEAYIALKHVFRAGQSPEVYAALQREVQLQRYLHALLGEKGEPIGLLY